MILISIPVIMALLAVGTIYIWPFNEPIRDGFNIPGFLQGMIVLALTIVVLFAFIGTVIELANQ